MNELSDIKEEKETDDEEDQYDYEKDDYTQERVKHGHQPIRSLPESRLNRKIPAIQIVKATIHSPPPPLSSASASAAASASILLNESIDVTQLHPEELEHLREVIERDKILRQSDLLRRKHMEIVYKREIERINLASAVKSPSNTNTGSMQDDAQGRSSFSVSSCAFCAALIGAPPSRQQKRQQQHAQQYAQRPPTKGHCEQCGQPVCAQCVRLLYTNSLQICPICFLKRQQEMKCNNWFHSFSMRSGRLRRSGSVVLMSSLKRAKKLNNLSSQSERKNPAVSSNADVELTPSLSQLGLENFSEFQLNCAPPLQSQQIADSKRTSNSIVSLTDSVTTPPTSAPPLRKPRLHAAATASPNHSKLEHELDLELLSDKKLVQLNRSKFGAAQFDSSSPPIPGAWPAGLASTQNKADLTGSISSITSLESHDDSDKKSELQISIIENRSRHLNNSNASRANFSPKAPPSSLPSKRSSPLKNSNVFLPEKSKQTAISQQKNAQSCDDTQPDNLLLMRKMSKASTMSVYSETEESYRSGVKITGQVTFALSFAAAESGIEPRSEFSVFVQRCTDIALADRKKNRTDSYIKTYLLPDKTRTGKRKSPVKPNSVNPVFEQHFRYAIELDQLQHRILSISIWHKRFLSANLFLGEVLLPLANLNLPANRSGSSAAIATQTFTLPFRERQKSQLFKETTLIYCGELLMKLKFSPPTRNEPAGVLIVHVDSARNLQDSANNKFAINAFCKISLLPLPTRHPEVNVRRTGTIPDDCNPTWNCTETFENVLLTELKEMSIQVAIYHHAAEGATGESNEFLGGVRLNLGLGLSHGVHTAWMDASVHEESVWANLLSQTNQWIDAKLMLRSNLDY